MTFVDAQNARTKWNLKPHAMCGMVAPILFALMVFIEGSLVPGYSQASQPISDLGAYSLYGSYAVLQNLNFWFFGVLVFTLAVGLGIALPDSGAATNSLALFAVLAFAAGLFSDRPSPYPGDVHSLLSITAFVLVILSQFFFWRRLRHSTGKEKAFWGRYGTYSLVSGVLSLVFLIVFILGLPQTSSYYGLGQRIFVAVPWLWIGVMAAALYGSESTKGQNGADSASPVSVRGIGRGIPGRCQHTSDLQRMGTICYHSQSSESPPIS